MPVNESHESMWIWASMMLLWAVMLVVTGNPKDAARLSTFFFWRHKEDWEAVWSDHKTHVLGNFLIHPPWQRPESSTSRKWKKASQTGVKLVEEEMHIGNYACMHYACGLTMLKTLELLCLASPLQSVDKIPVTSIHIVGKDETQCPLHSLGFKH